MELCRDCGTVTMFSQSEGVGRYHETDFASQFKPLLTLLELIGVNLHDAFPGVGR